MRRDLRNKCQTISKLILILALLFGFAAGCVGVHSYKQYCQTHTVLYK